MSARTPERSFSAQIRRILVTEDHPATRAALGRFLTRRGYDVVLTASIGEAMAAANAAPFDLLLSDLGLPDGSGLDLMIDLAARFKLRGIALTGYGREEDVARSLKAGFLTHLTKPVDIRLLEAAILLAESGRDPAT